MDCIVRGIATIWTQLSDFHFHCSLEPERRNDYDNGSQVALVAKNPPASAGDIRDTGSIHGSGRSPGGRHGNPLQYSCLENPMDRGGWQARVHRVAKSQL